MSTKRCKRHSPEQLVTKLRDANAGQDLAAVLQSLVGSEITYHRWRLQYGGMKSEAAERLKQLEDENRRLKQIVADKELDIQMLKHVASGTWQALRRGVRRPQRFRDDFRFPNEGPAQRRSSREVRSDIEEGPAPIFAHMCENGGSRRTWLLGLVETTTRYLVASVAHILRRVLLKMFGVGKSRGVRRLVLPFSSILAVMLRLYHRRLVTPFRLPRPTERWLRAS